MYRSGRLRHLAPARSPQPRPTACSDPISGHGQDAHACGLRPTHGVYGRAPTQVVCMRGEVAAKRVVDVSLPMHLTAAASHYEE